MLHANELPFRHLFDACDGGHGTTGPNSFGGPLGQEAKKDLHLMDVVDFSEVPDWVTEISDEVVSDLSRDQKLLYRYIKAVSSGVVPPSLVTQQVGQINHSRWLTLAIRMLQLYTRTPQPSEGLKAIVRFIQQVYGPSWFAIKCSKKFTSGPALLFQQMNLIKTQPVAIQKIVKPVVQRNAFMAEPGIMLCSMLESPSLSVRRLAMEKIMKLRNKPPRKPRAKLLRGIRSLKLPALNWNPYSWTDIIDWEKTTIHEPFIIECLSDEDIAASWWQPPCFPSFPLHTQTVERAVKLVTEASSKVEGEERRHGRILSVIEARRCRKPFDTKKDYAFSH